MPMSFLRSVAALLCAATVIWAQGTSAWWNDDWSSRKPLKLDTASVLDGAGGLENVVVPVLLHRGNFPYFLNTAMDGADLRFIAADDATPLTFHLELYDPITEVGVAWVKLPSLAADGSTRLWLYYGNEEAAPVADSAATFDRHQVLVYHFGELSGNPRDATAYGLHASDSTTDLGAPGVVGSGVRLDGRSSIRVSDAAGLRFDSTNGMTVGVWLRSDTLSPSGRILALGEPGSPPAIEIGLEDGRPYVALATGSGEAYRANAQGLVAEQRWQHLAIVLDDRIRFFLDGAPAGETAGVGFDAAGSLVVGAVASGDGFSGILDELQVSSVARVPEQIRAAAALQRPDGELLSYGEDEFAQTGGLGAYFSLFWSLLASVRPEGWAIIGIIILIGIASFDVIVGKAMSLRRTRRSDDAFLARFEELLCNDLAGTVRDEPEASRADHDFRDSGLYSLFRAGLEELRQATGASATNGRLRPLNAQQLEMVRAGIDAELVTQTDRLNTRLIAVTIAVSGGPFLGLFGTVVGVMVTFATIAAEGDVNVNTIAPGVAAALVTTVMGLLIAIPSLFGYNYLTSRITRRISAMEVFADRFVSRLAAGTAGLAPPVSLHETKTATQSL